MMHFSPKKRDAVLIINKINHMPISYDMHKSMH